MFLREIDLLAFDGPSASSNSLLTFFFYTAYLLIRRAKDIFSIYISL